MNPSTVDAYSITIFNKGYFFVLTRSRLPSTGLEWVFFCPQPNRNEPMKAYKIELLIIDHDDVGEEAITELIVNARYPNRCISPDVKEVTAVDIGEWSDDHPLNKVDTCDDEYYALFHFGL